MIVWSLFDGSGLMAQPWAEAGHTCYCFNYDGADHGDYARDAYVKKTCLWVGNGFVMPSAAVVTADSGDNPGWAKLGGKSARTKTIRSLTPRGFAKAVYEANYV